ncbi:Protein O-linked-mannose beta-1,2-N-acetylglucosaminyltransferase 1 [Amphibalanus amphitrite]|uniref:Alpha-1,3-mannosyl-glycoprotein 2-beta-N-acetylglucosaminyltransferase n=1 Tax=Amphibalanus amphitrite TaxID=1232801 RepID=A0A6A4V677_AMPAM|nr:protein O-linked-mannose beta-1,2-N-acetylglucosaminyltransferase 1-like [Amphibalanus amphitrite]KAF0289223.1 Protein O-linked-mannose beta-1,2-N-acetylglucosaminyltransferase 1 [Amphibalanus amphitrite]
MLRSAEMRSSLAVILSVVVVCCGAGIVPPKSWNNATIGKDIIEPGRKYVPTKKPDHQRSLQLVLVATKTNATLHVDGKLAWWHSIAAPSKSVGPDDRFSVQERGLHVLRVHPITGQVQGHAVASGWMLVSASHAVRSLVRTARDKDVLVFFTVGEFGPGMRIDTELQEVLERLGAEHFTTRMPPDMYAMVCVKGGPVITEAYVANRASPTTEEDGQSPTPASPLAITAHVPVPQVKDVICPWKKTPKNLARAKFCFNYDGYGELCDCNKHHLLPMKHSLLKENNITDVPIVIIASNRPQVLFRQMSSLLRNRGIIVSNILVFVDGLHHEVEQLCSLLDIKCVAQTSDYDDATLRIRENYRQALTNAWHHFPAASRLIVLEEDLEVSPDFVNYFSQTSHLLDMDSSLWCISAWNDNGFDSTSSDPAALYRVEYFPGLGWMMTRNSVQQLLDVWPSEREGYDWDVWVRWDSNRLERECIIPDVSRTYHFGISGSHTSSAFHALYYQDHTINQLPDVQLRNVNGLLKDEYEKEIRQLIAEAEPIKATDFQLGEVPPSQGGPCELELEGTNKTYAFFFKMKAWEDTDLYKTVAKCFTIWDLDVRGHHHGLWRFHYYENTVLMFAVPLNMYMNDVIRLFKHPVDIVQSLQFGE